MTSCWPCLSGGAGIARARAARAARAVNVELLRLYWSIGRDILDRQEQSGWGSRVIDRLAVDLRQAFPDIRGFSVRNLHYMRAVAAAWPTEVEFLQTPAAELVLGGMKVGAVVGQTGLQCDFRPQHIDEVIGGCHGRAGVAERAKPGLVASFGQ